jgi:hypothetical protein
VALRSALSNTEANKSNIGIVHLINFFS